jgi:hypothetical protein
MEDHTQPEPAAPEIQTRIKASFERQGLMRHLGARLGDIEPGRVRIVLPSRPEVTQQDGYIHAGATSAIADSAGGYAAFTLFPENTVVLTVEYKNQPRGTCRRRSPRGDRHSPQVRTNPHRLPTRGVRRSGSHAIARCRRTADADLRAGAIRTVRPRQ